MAAEHSEVPDFANVDEFKTWVHGLDENAIQKWTTEEWVDMYHKIDQFRSFYGSGSEMVKNCPEEFIKLYRNYRFEPEQLKFIEGLAYKAGEQLATEDIDAARLAFKTQKYYPVEVPDFEHIDDFKAWVAGLDERQIQRWKADDWYAVYEKVDDVRAWPDWKYEQKLRAEGVADEFIKEAKALTEGDKVVYFNQKCFDYSCKDELDKLFKNSTLKPKEMDCVKRLMQRNTVCASANDLEELATYMYDRKVLVKGMTETVENITANTTEYLPEQRLNVNCEINEDIGASRGDANVRTKGKATIRMNTASVADNSIGTAAHEAAHVHFQVGNHGQIELLQKGIMAHPELGKDFAALMMYNHEFYMHPDYIDDYCRAQGGVLLKEYQQNFRGYSHEPIEKFSQVYGLQTERAYREVSGQISERAAMRINGIIDKTPKFVQYTEKGIELTYRAGMDENFSGEKLLKQIKGKFRNSVLEDMNVMLDEATGEVKVTVPKSYEKQLARKNPLSIKQQIVNADNKVNKAIDDVIEYGSKQLNNSKVGKAYSKAKQSVSNSTVVKKTKEVTKSATQKVGQSKTVKSVKKVAQKTGQAVAKSTAGKAVQKAAAKTVGSAAAKAVGKSVLKKVPIIGLGVGMYYALERLTSLDYTGAALELASGAASTLPGLGTAASVAIDVGIAGRDVYNSCQEEDATKKQVKQDVAKARAYAEQQQRQVSKAAKPKTAQKQTPAQKQATAAEMKANAQKAKQKAATQNKTQTNTAKPKTNQQQLLAKSGGRE